MSLFTANSSILATSHVAHAFDSPDNTRYLVSGSVIVAISVLQYLQARKRRVNVPSVGPSGWLTSYFGAVKFVKEARSMLQEGYEKYKTGTFKIPEMTRWLVVVNTPKLIDEIRNAPEDKLSFWDAVNENIPFELTMSPLVMANMFQVDLVRSQLTRNIAVLVDGVKEEIALGFDEGINANETEWVSRPALDTVMQTVCRATNRVFVGLPVCRDKDYIDLNIRFTIDVAKSAHIIHLFPGFMQGLVTKFMTSVPAGTRRAIEHLQPIIEYRLRQEEQFGPNWPDKPNDFLSWCIDCSEGEERSVLALTQRILAVNFAAIHTSSMSFTHALLHLAARPEYIAPLREEVESVISTDGWTKASVQKMRKIDSFLKESARYNTIQSIILSRKARVDYTLSDGTFLPAGTIVACNQVATHYDNDKYPDAHEFRPFRFSDMRDSEGTRHQLVSTSVDYLAFGHGRHACPGRFFAANELKCMMAYLILHYDIKLPEGQQRPKDIEFGFNVSPDPAAHVFFRRRQA